jgi:hypothetical protein
MKMWKEKLKLRETIGEFFYYAFQTLNDNFCDVEQELEERRTVRKSVV